MNIDSTKEEIRVFDRKLNNLFSDIENKCHSDLIDTSKEEVNQALESLMCKSKDREESFEEFIILIKKSINSIIKFDSRKIDSILYMTSILNSKIEPEDVRWATAEFRKVGIFFK